VPLINAQTSILIQPRLTSTFNSSPLAVQPRLNQVLRFLVATPAIVAFSLPAAFQALFVGACLAITAPAWAQSPETPQAVSPATAIASGAVTSTVRGSGTSDARAKAPAQTSQKPALVAPGKPPASRPTWSELTLTQQQALRPLAGSWDGIREAQKRKWLEISKNYPALTPEEQAVLHSRMNEWVTLSPEQRAQARLNFAKTTELSRELTPEEKQAKWQAYQALGAEEKARLAAKAAPKPAGAATAVRPVAPQKLAVLPPRTDVKPDTKPDGAPASPKLSPGP